MSEYPVLIAKHQFKFHADQLTAVCENEQKNVFSLLTTESSIKLQRSTMPVNMANMKDKKKL